MNILIIGGSDAGISAALRARELDTEAAITVLLADSFPNYSICGLPFYLSGETPDWHQLAHRTEFEGITIRTKQRAKLVDPVNKLVLTQGSAAPLVYDRLVIATGAVPAEPPIAGLHTPGVYLLHTMEDSFRVYGHLTDRQPQSAVIIGAGYIGLEMADALTHRGIKVTLVSRPQTVLPTIEPDFGRLIEAELQRHGIELWTGTEINSIESISGALSVQSKSGASRSTDLVIVATGVRPSSELADAAGIRTSRKGAIRVNQKMETNVSDIYAAGDCVETWHRLLGAYTYLPLGTTSHKQGRVAGENAVGGDRVFEGSVGTQVVKPGITKRITRVRISYGFASQAIGHPGGFSERN
jgi:NADPH-dependent 2,4-dienoyl-CoA reductase/sulfur reductase-like enzyme